MLHIEVSQLHLKHHVFLYKNVFGLNAVENWIRFETPYSTFQYTQSKHVVMSVYIKSFAWLHFKCLARIVEIMSQIFLLC